MTPWQEGVRVTTVKDKVPGSTCELLSLPAHYRDLILHYPTLSISALQVLLVEIAFQRY